MQDWDFWAWVAYALIAIPAFFLALDEALKRVPMMQAAVFSRVPVFMRSSLWAFAPLILLLAGSGVFAARQIGWLPSPHSEVIVHETTSPLDAIKIAKDSPYPWISVALNEVGQRERQNNPRVIQYVATVRDPKGVRDDRIDWASHFVEWSMNQAGIKGPKSEDPFAWLNWGRSISKPEIGSVVVFEIPPSGYRHVGFVVGESRGELIVLGGNQDDSVSVKPFYLKDAKGYRLPPG
jgi:uncharacterized protein (TIGR02594 family)